MEPVHPLVAAYADRFTTPEPAFLQDITAFSEKAGKDTHMLSGHLQGRLLESICRISRPQRVLEIGTFLGYSTICMARGLGRDGIVETIELRQEDADIALKNFQVAGVADRINLYVGAAADIIPRLKEDRPFDLVFIDADKTGYIEYYELVLPRLSDKGFILADNVLFHGQVLEEPVTGKSARAIEAFNRHVAADGRTEQVLLTVRDGLMLITKK